LSLRTETLRFGDLGLSAALLRGLADMGVAQPTPIQQQAIVAALQGRDVWAAAPTGSGKTLAYALPLVQQRAASPAQGGYKRPVRALVLVPTRELAVQVGEVITALAYPLHLRVGVVYGGVSINPQMMALRGGADIVVATPGRLLDLVDHNAVRLGDVQQLVLDEADRLLDDGFADEWQRVQALLPTQRQTLLFSATFATEVQALAEAVLNDPVRLSVQLASFDAASAQSEPSDLNEAAPDIRQRAVAVDTRQRAAVLRHLLKAHAWPQALVFVATRYACEHMVGKLERGGVRAAALHGELTQGGRQQVLAAFKAGQVDVLVATDLASRGIDVLRLPVVINADVARSATDHVHRIGRTGRAGATGEAITLVTAENREHWQQLCERLLLDVPLEVLPGFEPTDPVPAPRPLVAADGGGIKGKRPSKKDKLRAAAARQSSAG
jgi:ATP-dependent RNA helicase RhlE